MQFLELISNSFLLFLQVAAVSGNKGLAALITNFRDTDIGTSYNKFMFSSCSSYFTLCLVLRTSSLNQISPFHSRIYIIHFLLSCFQSNSPESPLTAPVVVNPFLSRRHLRCFLGHLRILSCRYKATHRLRRRARLHTVYHRLPRPQKRHRSMNTT